jgi:hypothetical protein
MAEASKASPCYSYRLHLTRLGDIRAGLFGGRERGRRRRSNSSRVPNRLALVSERIGLFISMEFADRRVSLRKAAMKRLYLEGSLTLFQ